MVCVNEMYNITGRSDDYFVQNSAPVTNVKNSRVASSGQPLCVVTIDEIFCAPIVPD